MSAPKRHHFVSQMLLKRFVDTDGWLHWCRPQAAPALVRRARPAELFHEKHLYSVISETGDKDPAMEHRLAALEGDAAGVIETIVAQARRRETPVLTPEQTHIWQMFFLVQWRRTPETQQFCTSDAEADRMIDAILDELRAKVPHRLDEIARLATPEAKARTIRNVRVEALRGYSDDMLAVLDRRGIAVLRIDQANKQFILGSRPVAKLTVPGCTDLNDPRVELWLPVAPDIAVGIGKGDPGVTLFHTLHEGPVRQLNLAIARQSAMIASGSPALVRSIANAR